MAIDSGSSIVCPSTPYCASEVSVCAVCVRICVKSLYTLDRAPTISSIEQHSIVLHSVNFQYLKSSNSSNKKRFFVDSASLQALILFSIFDRYFAWHFATSPVFQQRIKQQQSIVTKMGVRARHNRVNRMKVAYFRLKTKSISLYLIPVPLAMNLHIKLARTLASQLNTHAHSMLKRLIFQLEFSARTMGNL